MAKSMVMAYCLWMVGGWYGLHHFYLRRDRHALIWWMTAGGCFGLGCFRDMWRIPEYVHAANNDASYIDHLKRHIQRHSKPPFSLVRFFGEMIVGWLLGVLVQAAIPELVLTDYPFLSYIRRILGPLGIAVGVHLIANVGHEQVSLKSCIIGAYILSPLFFASGNFNHSILCCAVYVNWYSIEWRLHGLVCNRPEKKNACKRLGVLLVCGFIYSGLWFGAFYHNAYITTSDGEQIPLKDAIHNFFTSPAWEDTKFTIKHLWILLRKEGFSHSWQEFNASLDPEGESHAYKTLGLPNGASEQEVTVRYRKLVKQWHPDAVKDPSLKQEAEQKFMAIQHAYETLSRIKDRRMRSSRRSRPNP